MPSNDFIRLCGIFLIIVGVASYIYPEVTFRGKEPASVLRPVRVSEMTIEVPRFVSIGSTAIGLWLVHKSLNIKKRKGQSR